MFGKSDHEKSENEERLRPMALTVKAVVVKDNEVLLLKRAQHCLNGGKWDLPGGHLEEKETIEEALKREVKEEANIEIEVGPVIKISEFAKDHEQFKNEKRGVRYLTFYKSGQVKTKPDEHDEFQWKKIDETIAMLGEDGFEKEKKETLRLAQNYLQMQNALDGWKRALADMENYKKRSEKINEEFRKYCLEDFILEILPVIDNFEMASDHIPAGIKDDSWAQGLLHIKSQLENVLKSKGIEMIDTKPGDEIDVNIHEVLQAANGEGAGKVKKVLKKGYRMGERILRAAVVEAE